MTGRQRREGWPKALPWAAMGLVLVVALAVGAGGDGGPPTFEERVRSITAQVRCPTCRSQSVADSDSPAAQFIRDDVRERLRAGESDEQILGYLVSRYGDDIRLEPESTGVAGVVWFLPMVAALAAVTGLVFAFRRWRVRPSGVSEADRRRVEEALAATGNGEAPSGPGMVDE